MKQRLLILISSFLVFGSNLIAQNQTQDSSYVHSPRRATMLSVALPGAGQIYNGKWWKAPIVYGGIGLSVYSIIENQRLYGIYKDAFILRTDGDPNTVDDFDPSNPNTPIAQRFTEPNLRTLIEYYQRNRDLSYIAVAAVYVLQIIDANVDAHLYSFDVSDNLSMRIQPSIFEMHNSYSRFAGLQIKFSLR